MKALISDIKRFAVHDGEGIRTTVFFKGCVLKCVWCHNPECIRSNPELAFYKNKCINCGECVSACKYGAHSISEKGHMFNKKKCMACGECEKVCPREALKLYGTETTVDELLPKLLEDRDFYDESGGGVTLSGGECLMWADFCAELLKRLKEEGINTAIDTCGYVSKEAFDKVLPYTDMFLYDIKAIDETVHKRCTGQGNGLILENLKYLEEKGAKAEIRIPYVPGYNDSEILRIRDFLSDKKNITAVKVLPYHNFAGTKYEAVGMENSLPPVLPTDEEIGRAEMVFQSFGK